MGPEETKTLILTYWKSWQEADWQAMRACLANTLDFGGMPMDADEFTSMCKNGAPWRDVVLMDSVFAAGHGALLYEGTDTRTDERIRVGEFIRVENGKVVATRACFGVDTPPR